MDHDQVPQAIAPAPHDHVVESYESAVERIQVIAPSPRDSSGASVGQPPSTSGEPLLGATSEGRHGLPRPHYSNTDFIPVQSPRPTARNWHTHQTSRHGWGSMFGFPLPRNTDSERDCIIPVDEKPGQASHAHLRRTVGERLKPTIDEACKERVKCAWKAKFTGYSLNFAIGLQVFLGALTTGISAALTGAKSAQITTAVLGGLSTLVASFLARARGSGEPEVSAIKLQNLEYFLRECAVFLIDHANEYADHHNGLNHRLEDLRRKLEEILGNTPGDKKGPPGLPPGIGITATTTTTATAPGPLPLHMR